MIQTIEQANASSQSPSGRRVRSVAVLQPSGTGHSRAGVAATSGCSTSIKLETPPDHLLVTTFVTFTTFCPGLTLSEQAKPFHVKAYSALKDVQVRLNLLSLPCDSVSLAPTSLH